MGSDDGLLIYDTEQHAAVLLREKKYRVSEICYMVGFNSPSYFSKCFFKQFGVKPADFAEEKQN